MVILGIETSCDETAAAILRQDENGIHILSNIVASSAQLQEKFGGIIPEQAAREQIKSIIPVIKETITQAFPEKRLPRSDSIGPRNDGLGIDAIAVTYGPGLIGSLLVGVETAKTLARVWNKPLIPVNHLLGHFYANWIAPAHLRGVKAHLGGATSPIFPCLGLLVSGGHTDLVLFTDHNKYKYLGGTRDDAAGECFDKCARLLGLPYPGGPAIAQRAMEFKIQNSKFKIELPRPLINENSFDFSFSGLKTATLREVERLKAMKQFNKETITQLAYEIQEAITDSLVNKVLIAIQKYDIDQIMIAGGVAANQKLVSKLLTLTKDKTISLHVPSPFLCTDNGAMIAAAGFFLPATLRVARRAGTKPIKNPFSLQANPNLSLVY